MNFVGKGFSRSNLFNTQNFYLNYPDVQTASGQLSWSPETAALGEVSKRHKAAEIILNMLAEGQRRRSTEVMDACADAGISEATTKRVKGYIGVKSL